METANLFILNFNLFILTDFFKFFPPFPHFRHQNLHQLHSPTSKLSDNHYISIQIHNITEDISY